MQMESQIVQVNIDDIIPNRFQPRLSFDDQGLKELAASIKEHGIIQPLVLRKLGSKYEIIAGERRYKASQMAGLNTVPAVISNIDDNSSAEVALVENIQRRDLTPIEEARSYKNLLDKGYLTQEQLAKKMGISQSAIANKLRLLNLDDEVQQALLEGRISERHARALLSLDSKTAQKEWLNRIITDRMTVRQLDQELKQVLKKNTTNKEIPLVDINPNVEEIKDKSVDINPNQNKNRNVANLMVPEDILTDYSSSLPQNTSDMKTINVPNSMDIMSNMPADDNQSPINKFFNTLESTPANVNGNNAFSAENTFNMNNAPELNFNFNTKTSFDTLTPLEQQPKKDIEIFDPTPKQEETITTPAPDFNAFETPIELNPNNRFFTPEPNNITPTYQESTPKQEELFDPMSMVESLEPIKLSSSLDNSIAMIKETITKLQNQGIRISYNETDEPLEHKITITIDK